MGQMYDCKILKPHRWSRVKNQKMCKKQGITAIYKPMVGMYNQSNSEITLLS